MSKTIFITGGSRGIGHHLVIESAKQDWNIAFCYLSNRKLAEELVAEVEAMFEHIRIKAYQLDVRNSKQVDSVCDTILDDFDTIDALIANAGVSKNGLVYSLSDDDWNQVISTNLSGSFFVCRAVLPAMIANKGGRIVMISSVSADGASGQAAYAASKSGLQGLCGTIAREYGAKGITANLVLPGYFETDMTRQELSDEYHGFALDFGPLRRAGSLDELAKSILFFVSDDAGFITGESIRVAGGIEWVP